MSTTDFAALSNNAIIFAGIVYALAMVAHALEWASALKLPVPVAAASKVPVGAGAPVDEPPAEVAASLRLRTEKFARIGVALTIVATGLHVVAVVARGLATDPMRVPWGNMYEFTLTASMAVSLIYLALVKRYHLRWMGLAVAAFQVVVLMLAALLEEPPGQLVPALDSPWLVIHVAAAILATGAFSVGGIASALYLVRSRAERRGTLRPNGVLVRLPGLDALDRVAYRLHAVGFPIWTFAALITGPIWAKYAWGSYWQWDPKEVWAFITWVVYAAYLHARATAGWKGNAAAAIALVGFATLLFNFVGINFFFGGSSQHSYAGG